jgi:hypothetical protein
MKKETRQEVNKILDKAQGTPKKNDLNVFTKDLQDAKRSNSEIKARIAIQEFKKWKKS